MGIMASALQMVEDVMGKIVQGLLMPKVAPAWYAGTRRLTEFPEAAAESLLLMGFVTLEVPDIEVAMSFFVSGLGAKEGAEVDGAKVVQIGASQLRLVPSGKRADLAAWPGQFYVWVEDSKATLSSCQSLEKSTAEVIQEVYHIKEEGAADAILLQDPAGQNSFVVNQAEQATKSAGVQSSNNYASFVWPSSTEKGHIATLHLGATGGHGYDHAVCFAWDRQGVQYPGTHWPHAPDCCRPSRWCRAILLTIPGSFSVENKAGTVNVVTIDGQESCGIV
ncbi:Uncharacterized protein SCF082_LOCUS39372 [Durusdinium trenchii]|uniref:Uncharacterized protein n=1 Tax=Durusdinium trenchii TaxID=1381693 RepID=A0ABP0Q6S7_9DINO